MKKTSPRLSFSDRVVKLANWAVVRMSTRREVLGLQLSANSLKPWMEPLFFTKVTRALALIGEVEPRRLARIQRDVRIIGGEPGGPSYWYDPLRMIALSWETVLPLHVRDVAMTIVHEATHARIMRHGIMYREHMRARIEAACVAQEAAFARLLPDGEALAEREMRTLEHPWWTPEAMHRGHMRRAKAYGAPKWLIAHFERRHEREQRRRAAALQVCRGESDGDA